VGGGAERPRHLPARSLPPLPAVLLPGVAQARRRCRGPGRQPPSAVYGPVGPHGQRQLHRLRRAAPLPAPGAGRSAQRRGRGHGAPGRGGHASRALSEPCPAGSQRKGCAERDPGSAGRRSGAWSGEGAPVPDRRADSPRSRRGPVGPESVHGRPRAPGSDDG
jgi:hypothetical protein